MQSAGKRKEEVTLPAMRHDFSSLLWYGAELDKLKEHLKQNIDLISVYPERSAHTLRRLLSRRLEVLEDQIMVTDGGTGAIHLVARVFEGKRSLIQFPTNAEIAHALVRFGHQVTVIDAHEDISKQGFENIDCCWLSTPNVTDGKLIGRRTLITMLRENPNVTFIVDLSMSAYVLEDTLKPIDVKKYKNLIVISSFSKAYNIPGLRVGYLVASKENIVSLNQLYTPRCVGAFAMEAIRYILLHPAQFTLPIRKWQRNAIDLTNSLRTINGLEIETGAAPFFKLVLPSALKAVDLNNYLLDKFGIKVGTCEDDIQLNTNELRVTALGAEANQLLKAAIEEWMSLNDTNLLQEW